MASEGWRCPSCGSVYAPWVWKCSTCPPTYVVAPGTTTLPADIKIVPASEPYGTGDPIPPIGDNTCGRGDDE